MRSAIVLLGMHRSGTSALSKVIGQLGASLGPSDDVTDGGSEFEPIRECNQALVNGLGGHWSAPIGFEPGWTLRPEARVVDARARLALQALASEDVVAWKDPRTCFTLPFWLERLAIQPVLLITFRHPLEVAASLDRRNQFGVGLSLALWESYNRSLLAAAEGLPAVVTNYESLMGDSVATLDAVRKSLDQLGIVLAGGAESAASAIDSGSRHHVIDELPPDVLTPQQLRLWDQLRGLPAFSSSFVRPQVMPMHPASRELVEQRAATIRLEHVRDTQAADLRSRRVLARRLGRGIADFARPKPRAAEPER